jgi:hypothetical protein
MWLAGAMALALVGSGAAEAAVIGPGSLFNGNVVSDFSEPNEIDFDADFLSVDPIILEILLDDDDDADELAFSAFVFNSTPQDWTDFHITLLGGPTFASIGEFQPETSLLFQIIESPDGTAVEILFDPAEFAGFTLGNAFDPVDPLDWFIDLNGLSSGEGFQMRLQPRTSVNGAPEPASLFLLGAGWMALALVRRHRRPRR